MEIITAIVTLGGLGLTFGLLLALVAQWFAVEQEPGVDAVLDLLPGANCGVCGYAGCANFAEAVVKGEAEPSCCFPAERANVEEICEIIGVANTSSCDAKKVVELFCIGDKETAKSRFYYDGVPDCRAAQVYGGGFKGCTYSCLGLGTCAKLCPFEAITMNEKSLPVIDAKKCVGCELCIRECPRAVLQLVDEYSRGHTVLCSSKDKGKTVRGVCDAGCIACRICEKVCEKNAINVRDNLAVIDPKLCNNCGCCLEKCPRPVIVDKRTNEIKDQLYLRLPVVSDNIRA